MDRDQAAAVLGATSDAYFKVDCKACDGGGKLPINGSYHTGKAQWRGCPHCDGTGEAAMPDENDILLACLFFTDDLLEEEVEDMFLAAGITECAWAVDLVSTLKKRLEDRGA